MAPDTGSIVKQSVQARTSSACQRCRALKSRCMPSGQPGVCQRCSTSKRDCIWPETRQRTNPPRGPSRISQVERKLDGLVASITHNRVEHAKSVTASPGASENDSATRAYSIQSGKSRSRLPGEGSDTESVDHLTNPVQDVADMHNFESDCDHSGNDKCVDAEDEDWGSDDHLTKSLQEHPEMESLFEQYRHMAPSFPFVLIDSNMTAQTMENRKLQLSFDKKYRGELALRTFTQSRKTLALLQSMLIYMAWYYYFASSNLSNDTMLQTAIGMASELRLNPQTIPQLLPGRNPLKRVRGGTDGQRALLGCYYLSSSGSTSLATPNLFTYSSYMSDCIKKLEQDSQIKTDRVISYVVRARCLADQIHRFLHPYEYQSTLPAREQLMIQLRIWEAQIAEWWQEASMEDSHMLKIEYHGNRMELYYSVFRHLCRGHPENIETVSETQRIEILSACLEAGRSLLDVLISIPTEQFPLLSHTTWTRLPRVIIILAMFTSPSDHHEVHWDVQAARDRVRLDLFIESLCFRMQSLTTFNPPSQPQPDSWLLMKTVLQSVGKWYKRAMTKGTTMLKPPSHSHTTNYDPYSKATSSIGSTLDIDVDFATAQTTETGVGIEAYRTTFPYTPDSTLNTHKYNPQFDMPSPTTFQPPPGTLLCPMMRLDNGPELDQFLEAGFWADGYGGFDMTHFDFPT